MWIYLNNAFLSIVENDTNPNLLHIRARHSGDIEAIFSDAVVLNTPSGDYKHRADIPRDQVATAIAVTIGEIDYVNFKNSVSDENRHDVYFDVWSASHGLHTTQ